MMRTLIALDMDGTLLDPAGNLPPQFHDVATRCAEAGLILAPASGRQLATLQAMFPETSTFIAENGTVVVHDGEVVGTTTIAPEMVSATLDATKVITAPHMVVLCTPTMSYVEHAAPADAATELEKYYKAVTFVEDFHAVLATDPPVIKIAIFCSAGTEEHVAPPLSAAIGADNVAISGRCWIDVMAPGANKGTALRQLAGILDIPMERTVAFGDYLNDYELLRAAGTAIAMENAHPDLKAIADRIAPPNTEYGVMTVLDEMLTQAQA